jgi:hypothetical protein
LRFGDFGRATLYLTVPRPELEREAAVLTNAFRTVSPIEVLASPDLRSVLCSIRTGDFRTILDAAYPWTSSAASGVTWTFAVPLRRTREIETPPVHGAIEYTINLRLRRNVYVLPAIEEVVVERILEAVRSLDPAAQLLCESGWSDFNVIGRLGHDRLSDFTALLFELQNLRVQTPDDSFLLFNDVSSTLAEPVRSNIDMPGTHAVVSFRVPPGRWREAVARVYERGARPFLDTNGRVSAIGPASAFRDSDLPFIDESLFFLPLDANETAVAPEQQGNECSCSAAFQTLSKQLFDAIEVARPTLNRGDLQPIHDGCVLLQRMARDTRVCCDLRLAVQACIEALLSIFPGGARLSDFLDEWHQFVETLHRQRGTSLCAATRRGAWAPSRQLMLHKLGYLADSLINDFARRLDPNAPAFGTVFDPNTAAANVAGTGLVNIPLANAFTLPLSIPDLWHEVGVALFFRRLAGLGARSGEEQTFLITNSANYYADLLVYLYGFGANIRNFLVTITHGWMGAFDRAQPATQATAVASLLTRWYLVYEFHSLRNAIRTHGGAAAERFMDPDVADSLIRELQGLVYELHIEDRFRLAINDAQWGELKHAIRSEEFSRYYRVLYASLIRVSVDVTRPSIAAYIDGVVEPFEDGADFNAYFGEAAATVIADRPAFLRLSAALSQAAIAAYRRLDAAREATRERGDAREAKSAPAIERGAARALRNETARERPKLRAFLCHAKGDRARVMELYDALVQAGADAWFDEENLLPGHDWQFEIGRALRATDVVVACLSKFAIGRTGYMQKELRDALDLADLQPEGSIYIIPAKLDDCDVPSRLSRWTWLDLRDARWKKRLVAALQQCAEAKGLASLRVP